MSSPYLLDRDSALLCVVDIQTKLAAAMAEREAVIRAARQLILSARRLSVPILITQQYTPGLGPTEPDLVEALGEDYRPIEKPSFSCCRQTAFAERVAQLGRTQIILCGMETHVCLLQTAMDLLHDGYQVHMIADAACSKSMGPPAAISSPSTLSIGTTSDLETPTAA